MTNKASPLAAGIALGIFCGLMVFFVTLLNAVTGSYGAAITALFDSIYPWYSVSVAGSVLGLVYGLVDGFIVGFIVVWLYNRFVK